MIMLFGGNRLSLLAFSVALNLCALVVFHSAHAKPMMTEWGEKVTDENAWRSYPRPQMERSGWTCLNGGWNYAITSITNTMERPRKWDGKIRVPFALEAPLSGCGGRLLAPDEYLWYSREIELDPKPGERILLNFGAVDFRAIVYLGHDEVAATPHEGGNLPFTVDLTPYAKKGTNVLTVLVWDPTEDFIQSRGKQEFRTHSCFYTRVSGIWQSVWLEIVPERHIFDYNALADIEKGEVTLTIDVDGCKYADREEGLIEIDAHSQMLHAKFTPGEPVTVKLPAPIALWTPETPALYNFTAKFGKDEIRGYFAMRKFEKRKDPKGVLRFYLNNRPYYVMGTLDQGWWPDGLLTPPSEEAMEFDIKTLKACGFNTMRKHIKVEPLRYYALCDRLGLLVLQDMPSSTHDARDPYDASTVKGYSLYREELKGLIDLLRKVPSIVMWVPYNEGWGQHDAFLTHTTLDFVKKYDPSRLVVGPSGWNDFEGGEYRNRLGDGKSRRIVSNHKKEGECEAADVVDYHYYRGPKMPPVNDRRVSFLGEFGGLGHPVEGHLWRDYDQGSQVGSKDGDWGYGGIEDTKTREGLEATYLGLMESLGILAEKGLAGSIYTQTTDVEIEINGLLTYDRKVLKFAPEVLRKAHEKVIRQAEGGDNVHSPAYFWMWNGKLDAEVLCRQLDDMHSHGLRNVCIHPVPKGFRPHFDSEMEPDYLTDGFLDVYAKVIRHARDLGMHAYLYDEGGWPSGAACGLVAESDKEGRFMPHEVVVGEDGKAHVGKRSYRSGWRYKYPSMIECGTTKRFLELTHDAYTKCIEQEMGSTLRIAFTDEPDMPRDRPGKSLAWTADFAEQFRQRKGYDIMPAVPALIADKSSTNSALSQMRIDIADVRADLFVERYFLPLRDWCRRHGMLSGGHINNEDGPQNGSIMGHGSLMRSLRAMDVPGVDAIWRQLFPASGGRKAIVNPFPRYASSAMHQNGGKFALSESFGIYGDSISPAQMKWIVDYQMVRGINAFVLAYYAQNNAKQWMTLMEPHSGSVVPYWDFQSHFFRYIERTSRFISQGLPGAEIVVLFNSRAFWSGKNEAQTASKAHYDTAYELDAMNCDYDFTEDRDIAEAEVTRDGRLKIGAMEYRTLVLPSEAWMLPAAKEMISMFKAAGGIVVRREDLGMVPRTLHVAGEGARAMRVMKRVDGERIIWFLMNEDMEDRCVELDFAKKGSVLRYNPDRDEFECVSINGKVNRMFIGGETAIYVTGKVPVAEFPARYEDAAQEIASGWTIRPLVSHEAGATDFEIKSCEEKTIPVSLGDWRSVLGEKFSGKAVYRAEFNADFDGDAIIDIGKVKWCASMRLNGRDLGARFFEPFRWPVKVKKGSNILEVTVANLLVNQVGDDAFRNRVANSYPPKGCYEDAQRIFDRDNHESGLFGPVTIKAKSVPTCVKPTVKLRSQQKPRSAGEGF